MRLLEKLELWLRHRAERAPMTVYCYYCDVPITAPSKDIIATIESHQRHPAHKGAVARKEGQK